MATRLGRRTHLEDEDASILKLGAEFNNAGCLLISEVKILLKEKEGKPGVDNPVFNKTVEYVNMFSKFSTEDTIGLVRAYELLLLLSKDPTIHNPGQDPPPTIQSYAV
ncbi:RNA polymerase B [Serendipita sp. 399]|nr:RNA polymerase B [Serendipita sp. 399]